MADLTPAEELRAAVTELRRIAESGVDWPWVRHISPTLAKPLANLLDDLADEAEATYATEVHLGPDTTYPTGVVDYRGELRSHLTHALATARVPLGGDRG